jgi:manganese/zinc-transporting P-type ATPase C
MKNNTATNSQPASDLIRHYLPGRVRFQATRLHNRQAAAGIASCLGAFAGVRSAEANPACGSLLIRYDNEICTIQALLAELEVLLSKPFNRLPEQTTPSACPETSDCVCSAASTHPVDLSGLKQRFWGLTSTVAALFIRNRLISTPLTGGLFSPFGLLTAAFALPLVKRGAANLQQKKVNLDTFLGGSLMLAIGAGEVEAALEILWIDSGADLMKGWVTERSRLAISNILDISGHHTFVLRDGVEIEVPVSSLQPGDVVVLHTGEKVCVDGEVVFGEGLVDEAPITGRAEPVHIVPGSTVHAGTFVTGGVIHVQAHCVGDRTYLARILRLVEESQANRAPIEGVADRLAKKTVAIGFGATLATLLLTRNPWRAFTVLLVMACPCATSLAASSAVSSALHAAARRQILIKGGRYLEAVGSADLVCLDKTGTLTGNHPKVCEIISTSHLTTREILLLASTGEAHNHHPLAEAIKECAAAGGISPLPHSQCDYYLGKGIKAILDNREILVGNHKLMNQFSIVCAKAEKAATPLIKRGLTVIYLAQDRQIVGIFGIENPQRPETQQVIHSLAAQGCKLVMVTGDEPATAQELARNLGITHCHSSLLPEQKADLVSSLQQQGHAVIMVGDGINDALALTRADIGIAMGVAGSEVAIGAADIALVEDSLSGVLYVRDLGNQTLRIVNQNFAIATSTNIIGVVAGALGLMGPVVAGMLHIVHTLGILANSGRLLQYQSTPE